LIALVLLLLLALGTAGGALAQGSYQLDFEAALPTTYDHLTGEGAMAVHATSVESLQAGDFFCDDVVVFLLHLTAPAAVPAAETVDIGFAWDAEPTGQPGAGYTDLLEAEPNVGDPAMGTDGGETVTILSEAVTGSPTKLLATVRITDLESAEVFILRLEVRITCVVGSNPTGNLHGRIQSANVAAPGTAVISAGAQDVPMIGTPTFRPAAQPTPSPTATPTAQPTAQPTAPPTAQPTAPPTASPTTPPTSPPTPPGTPGTPTGGVAAGGGGTSSEARPELLGIVLLAGLGLMLLQRARSVRR
jgi:hypothetical protein